MKQIIRKILKEGREEKFIEFLMDKVKGLGSWESHHFLQKMSVPLDVYDKINDKVEISLRKIVGETFSIYDFDKVSVGNYEFDFTITDITITDQREYDSSGPHVLFNVILDGIVHLYDSEEDDMVGWDVNDARTNSELWEVDGEISDIIVGVLKEIVPLGKLSDMDMEFLYH